MALNPPTDSGYVMLNGKILPRDGARISPEMNGIYHGTGAFETMLSDRGAIFRFEDHVQRLQRGLQYLELQSDAFQDAEYLRGDVEKLLDANGLQEKRSRVRIQVSEAGDGGYSTQAPLPGITLITADELPDAAVNPVRLVTSPVRTIPSASRPAELKLSNMLHYRDAMRRAKRKGADDALLLSTGGRVAETAIANIFWFRKGIIRTPSPACDILPGIMRDALKRMVKESFVEQFEMEEGGFHPEDLHGAECAWITNSVRGITPVSSLDETNFETEHPSFMYLKKKMSGYIKAGLE
ncbi:aminotransferase class IV [Rhodohalobacter mucosus]|uniref:branched-chain-amino-acid transaminase n=1 Tax=Rhodohalobacter mucosus TaxID=2079485 RepID=A0A316TP13_9BACT|nr:aminotransferase class IV [Rhodohalobacter mucosus]PWN06353.1 hypothetical protein DDZ15_11065 [Rhodohalobacter mucosus]